MLSIKARGYNSVMTYSSNVIAAVFGVACLLSLFCHHAPRLRVGDEGHEVIGLIADHYLEPAVRAKVNAILRRDKTNLTSRAQIDREATWADNSATLIATRRSSLQPNAQMAFRGSGTGRSGFANRVFWATCVAQGDPASLGPADDLRGR